MSFAPKGVRLPAGTDIDIKGGPRTDDFQTATSSETAGTVMDEIRQKLGLPPGPGRSFPGMDGLRDLPGKMERPGAGHSSPRIEENPLRRSPYDTIEENPRRSTPYDRIEENPNRNGPFDTIEENPIKKSRSERIDEKLPSPIDTIEENPERNDPFDTIWENRRPPSPYDTISEGIKNPPSPGIEERPAAGPIDTIEELREGVEIPDFGRLKLR